MIPDFREKTRESFRGYDSQSIFLISDPLLFGTTRKSYSLYVKSNFALDLVSSNWIYLIEYVALDAPLKCSYILKEINFAGTIFLLCFYGKLVAPFLYSFRALFFSGKLFTLCWHRNIS